MGEYLSTPNKEKKTEEGGNAIVCFIDLFYLIFFILDEMGSLWYARLEENYGGLSYSIIRCS
jgi:hypothetical protein